MSIMSGGGAGTCGGDNSRRRSHPGLGSPASLARLIAMVDGARVLTLATFGLRVAWLSLGRHYKLPARDTHSKSITQSWIVG